MAVVLFFAVDVGGQLCVGYCVERVIGVGDAVGGVNSYGGVGVCGDDCVVVLFVGGGSEVLVLLQ